MLIYKEPFVVAVLFNKQKMSCSTNTAAYLLDKTEQTHESSHVKKCLGVCDFGKLEEPCVSTQSDNNLPCSYEHCQCWGSYQVKTQVPRLF